MNKYVIVSGIIFGLVALLHIIRLIFGCPVQIGAWVIPVWFSWGGLIVAGLLCIWAFGQIKK